MTNPVWLKMTSVENVIQLEIYVQPGAKKSGVVGEFDGELKIKISSPPVDGAANKALGTFIAQKLGIRARDVVLIQGEASRHKIFEIRGLMPSEISKKLLL